MHRCTMHKYAMHCANMPYAHAVSECVRSMCLGLCSTAAHGGAVLALVLTVQTMLHAKRADGPYVLRLPLCRPCVALLKAQAMLACSLP